METGPEAEYVVHTDDGGSVPAAAVIAATGSFAHPYRPIIPGSTTFTGQQLHVAEYRDPAPYAGMRVVVVGGGNSAVQVGAELARVASVTLATRAPIRFVPQRPLGRDLHHWLTTTGFDALPAEWLAQIVPGTLVLDTGRYRDAFESGLVDRRPMFTGFDHGKLIWADGAAEAVDVVLYATGYRPHLPYLDGLGALDAGAPRHTGGLSTTHSGLAYVGLEFQRAFASNTLRGVHRDAEHVIRAVGAHARRAPATIGL